MRLGLGRCRPALSLREDLVASGWGFGGGGNLGGCEDQARMLCKGSGRMLVAIYGGHGFEGDPPVTFRGLGKGEQLGAGKGGRTQ